MAVLATGGEAAFHTVEEAEAVLLEMVGAGLLGTVEEGRLGNVAAAVASCLAEEEVVHRIAAEEALHDYCCCNMEVDGFQVVEALLESHHYFLGNSEMEVAPCRQLVQAEEE